MLLYVNINIVLTKGFKHFQYLKQSHHDNALLFLNKTSRSNKLPTYYSLDPLIKVTMIIKIFLYASWFQKFLIENKRF